jgi:DNA-binding transcriptional LysR family regulator
MESQFLESFVAVIEHGSIAEAARHLNLTAAAIGLRIRALESEFGTPLLHRAGRTVVATEAGYRVFNRANTVLREINDLRELATSPSMTGQLRLGATFSAVTGLLPPILARFTHSNPQAKIFIQPAFSGALYRSVCDGDLDAAVMIEPQFEIPKTCQWHTWVEEPLILLTPSSMEVNHPHETLAVEPLIRYDRNLWGGKHADSYLRQAGIQPVERYELESLSAISLFVNEGVGVSLVPDWTGPWPEGLSLYKYLLPLDGFNRRVGLLSSKASVRTGQIDALIETAKLCLPHLRPDDGSLIKRFAQRTGPTPS